MPDQLTTAKDAKKKLEKDIQALINTYMSEHGLIVKSVNIHTEEYFANPFCSGVDVEAKL